MRIKAEKGESEMKKLQALLILLVGLLVLSACGSSDDESSAEEVSKDDADFVVGISQIEEHPALDSATEGFKQALKDAELEVHFDFSSAPGGCEHQSIDR